MGANAIATIAIGLTLMLCALYFAPDYPQNVINLFSFVGIPAYHVKGALTYLNLIDSETKSIKKESQETERLFTREELKKYDGGPDSLGLYLAILGEVFDVEKGAQHYRPGGGYAFFTGHDATRAYITGDFTEAGLIDNLEGLDDSSLSGIEDWLSFYREEYKPVGKVIGRYYDKEGNPTKELLSVKEIIAHNQKNKWLQDQEKDIFPPCNSEWSQEKGSKVWCSKKSGGIERDWVGVPRELHRKGKDPRCVCVRNTGPPSNAPDSSEHKNRGDLDHSDLKEYPGCSPNSDSCQVKHP